jgi:hypothetical protein
MAELLRAQTAVVPGDGVTFGDLAAAVDDAGSADRRWGEELRTHARWSALQTSIDGLRGKEFATRASAFATYSQITDQLLGLIGKVRDEAELLLDPGLDTHYLAEAATRDLPQTMIATEAYVARLALAGSAVDGDRAALTAAAVAAGDALAHADAVSEELEFAASATRRAALGRELVSQLDNFRRSVDTLVPEVVPAEPTASDVQRAVANRDAAQESGAALHSTVLANLDALLAARAGTLDGQRTLTLAVVAPAMVVSLLVGAVAGGRAIRRPRRSREWLDGPSGALAVDEAGTGARRGPVGPGTAGGRAARWERQGVAR